MFFFVEGYVAFYVMAYAHRRFRRRRFARRRPTFARRRVPRRSYGRRRRSFGRSVRSIRNIAARKCRDNMLGVPISTDFQQQNPGPLTMFGDTSHGYLFSPTARRVGSLDGSLPRGIHANSAERWKTRCFVKGLQETVELQPNNGAGWLWRRVVFSCIGLLEEFPTNSVAAPDSTRGYGRAIWNLRDGSAAATPLYNEMANYLFEGTRLRDWINPFTAKLDRSIVTVHSDTTRTIQSNNPNGTYKIFKRYYPVNRGIVYADDESGSGSKNDAHYAAGTTKGNSGDLFVLDLFNAINDSSENTMNFGVHARYYWHEGAGE